MFPGDTGIGLSIKRNDINQTVTIHNFVLTCLITFFEFTIFGKTFESKPILRDVHLQQQPTSHQNTEQLLTQN